MPVLYSCAQIRENRAVVSPHKMCKVKVVRVYLTHICFVDLAPQGAVIQRDLMQDMT